MSPVLQRVQDKLETFRVCATSVKFLEVQKFEACHYILSLVKDILFPLSSPTTEKEAQGLQSFPAGVGPTPTIPLGPFYLGGSHYLEYSLLTVNVPYGIC